MEFALWSQDRDRASGAMDQRREIVRWGKVIATPHRAAVRYHFTPAISTALAQFGISAAMNCGEFLRAFDDRIDAVAL